MSAVRSRKDKRQRERERKKERRRTKTMVMAMVVMMLQEMKAQDLNLHNNKQQHLSNSLSFHPENSSLRFSELSLIDFLSFSPSLIQVKFSASCSFFFKASFFLFVFVCAVQSIFFYAGKNRKTAINLLLCRKKEGLSSFGVIRSIARPTKKSLRLHRRISIPGSFPLLFFHVNPLLFRPCCFPAVDLSVSSSSCLLTLQMLKECASHSFLGACEPVPDSF